jgi:putative SOS response-associated peptidase YedK
MCYNIQEAYQKRIKKGMRLGKSKEDINFYIDDYNKRFPDSPIPRLGGGGYLLSGFTHPKVPIFTHAGQDLRLRPMYWGLIPHWCHDRAIAMTQWNRTLNARSETMFNKPAFRHPATGQRGVVLLQSFYEHHHFAGRSYAFNVRLRNNEPMYVAVLWDEWTDRGSGETLPSFTIVTIHGNTLMATLHNNPKSEEGSRMPLILTDDTVEQWLTLDGAESESSIKQLCSPITSDALTAHPVRPLSGKLSIGDVPLALEPYSYPELQLDTELMEVLHF